MRARQLRPIRSCFPSFILYFIFTFLPKPTYGARHSKAEPWQFSYCFCNVCSHRIIICKKVIGPSAAHFWEPIKYRTHHDYRTWLSDPAKIIGAKTFIGIDNRIFKSWYIQLFIIKFLFLRKMTFEALLNGKIACDDDVAGAPTVANITAFAASCSCCLCFCWRLRYCLCYFPKLYEINCPVDM